MGSVMEMIRMVCRLSVDIIMLLPCGRCIFLVGRRRYLFTFRAMRGRESDRLIKGAVQTNDIQLGDLDPLGRARLRIEYSMVSWTL